MQKLIWNGGGSGSYENPFKLESEKDSFDFTKPFNIHFKNNYEGLKEPQSYIKIDSKSTKYLLGIVINVDGSTIIRSKDAVDKTLFLTNYVDAIDGGYYVSRYEGVNYIIRQQLFNVFEVGEVFGEGDFDVGRLDGRIYDVENVVTELQTGKQDKLTAGANITIKNNVISASDGVDNEIFEVVSVLPTTGDVNKIYLVPSSEPQIQNELDQFIWVDNAWEKIGSVSIDLSNYFNKTEINSMLTEKQDKLVAGDNINIDPNTNEISASGDIGGAVDWQDVENKPELQDKLIAGANITIDENNVISSSGKGLSTNDFSDFYKSKLDEMIAFMGFIYIDGETFLTTPTVDVDGGNFVGFEPQGIIEGGNFI